MDAADSINIDKIEVSTPFLRDADIAELAQWPKVIAALAHAYAMPIKPAMVPARIMARGEGFWLRSLCAVSPSGEYMGCKLIAASPKIRRASYLISLFDQRTMELAALVDGNRITDLRTAGTAVVAANAVIPEGTLRVGVIGSGSVAKSLLTALLSVREVTLARVFSPTPASREKFASAFQTSHGLQLETVDNAQAAIDGVDIVVCAARSRDESPVLLGEWLQPGMVVL
ncbi:MAG: NAD(P)-binding domain-containing protein, partial [Pseudomonas sp.]